MGGGIMPGLEHSEGLAELGGDDRRFVFRDELISPTVVVAPEVGEGTIKSVRPTLSSG